MSNYEIQQSLIKSYADRYRINHNLLEASKFLFVMPNAPYLNFFAQTAVLPGVTGNPSMQPTPLTDIWRVGDKLMYDPLTITFLVDEDLRVWEEVYNWLENIHNAMDDAGYAKAKKTTGVYTDLSMLFLKNSNNDNLSVRFHKAFPVSLSPVAMSSQDDASTTLTADITLYYDIFKIHRTPTN